MTTPAKIRLLLVLLFASLLLTAIIVQKTYTPKNNLYQTGQSLEKNLHNQETLINDVINNKDSFDKLKTLQNNEQEAFSTIKTFTTDASIWLITTDKGRLTFWSGIKIIPSNPSLIHDGHSFIKSPNGYYEAIKKTDGNFSALFFIPVKISYPFQNEYLKNTFAKNLLNDNNVEIAGFNDRNIYEITSTKHTYLFSIKLKQNGVNHKFFYFEVILWILAFLTLVILIHSCCIFLADKGYVYLSILILGTFIFAVRFVNLRYALPNFTFKPDILNPEFFSFGTVFPTLGDFCINLLLICWFVAFVYSQRNRVLKNVSGKIAEYTVVVISVLVLIICSSGLLRLFYGLVINSRINFDINNVLNLTGFSMIGVTMLCFGFLIFYLLIEIILTICKKITVPALNQAMLMFAGIAIATLYVTYYFEFSLFYVFWGIWVLIRGYAYRYDKAKITSGALVSILTICAIVSSIKLNHFQSLKEREVRKELIKKLETPADATAEYIFKKIEKQIVLDPLVIKYFTDTAHNNNFLKNHFRKLYFDGYMSKYDFKIHEFNSQGQPLTNDKSYELGVFKDLVMYSSYKVSDYFYRDSESFGYQSYFAMLPAYKNNVSLGTIIIELNSKSFEGQSSFPELLIDSKIKAADDFKDYSYAFYVDNKLVSQNGKYVYSLVNTDFKCDVNQYAYSTTGGNNTEWYAPFIMYSHLVYRPSSRNLILVSKEESVFIHGVTSLTFFFIVFLVFSVGIIMTRWLWVRIRILYVKDNYLHWHIRLSFDKILYKTRIQFSIIFAVVITLVLVGFITYVSISNQYQAQQDNTISAKINRIAKAFENGTFNTDFNNIDEEKQIKFDEFATNNSADLTLFDYNGIPLISTQPKIYNYGLVSRRINARAYLYLHRLQKSELVNDERIGELSYKAAYVPIRDSKNETIGYLQLPYFSNENDYRERVGTLLNAMINIYALIFIAIGLFAVIIARQITNPLNFIQVSLSRTTYGKKNEPIEWSRNDEIGALVKEYNNMIAALEQSAQKLAQSERESAWREMAKQVAHEIKNPLTPLKLGLQLLEKSWRDKDAKFDQKFERFSKSFVEQIESLSSIASEFSAFAKMPDTRIERINIFDMLSQAVTIFKQMDNIKIIYDAPDAPFYINADRDQMLRCFNNLLKNAIEATQPGKMGIIEINYLPTNKNILLSMKDNGNGIPENLREKIFEPNFTTKSSGTGLGLAFVKNSIENAGGKVWFETINGTGTTFYFSLPESEAS